jgi:O-antigen biosynthesis protein
VTTHDPEASGRPRPTGPLEIVLEELAAVVRQADELAAAVAGGDADAADRAAALSGRLREVRRSVEWLGLRLASVDDLRRRLDQTSDTLRRLQARKSVRVALRAAELTKPLAAARRRLEPGRRRRRRRLDPAGTTAAILASRPDTGPGEGPLVSIVVPTRNGRHHLERLLDGLDQRTHYRSFELVVVDNASTDGTAELLEQTYRFPVRVIANATNASFSRSCNQGIEASAGEYVLLLNNDVDPVNPGWLGAMVTSMEEHPEHGACGALLVYPVRPGRPALDFDLELTVQHRGIVFGWDDQAPRPVNLGRGDDPTDPALTGLAERPAATAACLLVRRSPLEQIGGLAEEYLYGWEDVDLCLSLRDLGLTTAVSGDAALFHYEFGTQDTLGNEVRRLNYLWNRRQFAQRWAPRLSRTLRLDRLRGVGFWTPSASARAAITVTNEDPTAGFGDWYTAHELGNALGLIEWSVDYAPRLRDRWYQLGDDLALFIALLPQFDVERAPQGAVRVAWIRNWVDRWIDNESFERYDLAVCATSAFAKRVEARSSVPTLVLPLATNPERFSRVAVDPDLVADYAFTGNHWNVDRPMLDRIEVRPGEDFRIYGRGWDEVAEARPYFRGPLPYSRLPDLYSSTPVILDDTATPNLPALNSRVFDALATGALVITDNPDGSAEFFDGRLPAATTSQELRTALDHYLGDDDARTELVTELRERVLAEHSYRRRAEQFVTAADDLVTRPKVALRIGPPNRTIADQWGDTHFARAFARSLHRNGFATDITVLPEWDGPARQDADIVIHLRGLTPYSPQPAHLNVLWIISHPDEVSAVECERFDLVLVASEPFARLLRDKVDVPVEVLLQATDPSLFAPSPRPELMSDLLFVGNSRRQRRPAVAWAVERGLPLTLYGADWDDIVGADLIAGTHVPNHDLPALYSSASIVLNDHWPDMAAHGFISNRIFDALAAGTLVISDPVEGLEDLLGDAVPTFSDADELENLVRHFLAERDDRAQRVQQGMEHVREHHTFDARAARFTELITPLLAGRKLIL